MCEAVHPRPQFKGVVILAVVYLLTITVASAASTASRNQPKCVHENQELICQCEHFKGQVFPSNAFWVATHSNASEVRKIVLTSCHSLNVTLDLTPLSASFQRLTVQNVSQVQIQGISINSTDVELWFKKIENLTLTGDLNCVECGNRTVDLSNPEDHQRPELNMRVIDSGKVKFENFMQDSSVDLTIKTRNLQSFTTQDSYFTHFSKSSVELFNVEKVLLHHCEFISCSDKFLVVNRGVSEVNIKDCLLDENALETLSTTTNVTKKCTVSPVSLTTLQDLDPECVFPFLKASDLVNGGVETTGAITLALISSAILMTIVLLLFTWAKQGKLDPYL